MKRLLICLGILLIAGTILYAQQREGFPQRQPKAPQISEPQQPNMMGEDGMQWLKEEFPEKYEKLMQLKEQNPQMFEKASMGLRRLGMAKRLKTEDPEAYAMAKEMFELEETARELAEKYNTASSSVEKNKIKNETQNTLDKAFDLKLKVEERKLNQLKDKLTELEKFTEKRKANKDEIIKQHLADLLQEKDYLKW